ncbi:MAG: cysteine hydrolase [Alphaproteobacteria bacterium]|jgi:ureidoacrylate peracid hydrolase|nr:cysteine hydrolase [Alphaproteobacteria bacterium]
MSVDASILDLTRTALILGDLQNDFLHPDGAYGRSGTTDPDIASVPARVAPVAKAMRAAGGWVVSTHFTLVPGRDGEPFISPHLASVRPFLAKGDFLPGSWGQDLVEELKPADMMVEKVSFSAFYMSRLEWVLKKADIENLVFTGIVTNGGVASTLRDAHVRDFKTILLSDGCAAFGADVHVTAVDALKPVTTVMSCADFLAAIG